MKSILKKIISYGLIMTIGCGLLTGCAPSVDLTEEEIQQVSEYSAGLLLKYDKKHATGLTRVSDIDFEELNVVITPTPTPEPTPEPQEEEEEALVGNVGESDGEDITEEVVLPPLSDVFGLSSLNLSFECAEMLDSYPEASDLVFAMNATEGNNLLIMHFSVYNPGAETVNAFANIGEYKIRALVNGADKYRAELTFLNNDLTSYAGVLEPGQLEDVVLVFEVPEETELNSLGLLLVHGGEQLVYDF